MSRPAFDTEALYVRLDKIRRSQRLRWREIARAAGVCPSTFTRLGQGRSVSADSLVAILDWLGDWDLQQFTKRERSTPSARIGGDD